MEGVALRLSDTAGLREARDLVEELGVARSQERLAQADLVLYLVDGSDPLQAEDVQVLGELAGRPALLVINKTDLPRKLDIEELRRASPHALVEISALTGEGLDELKQMLVDLALGGGLRTAGDLVTQARHYELLVRAGEALDRGRELLGQASPPWELLALEVKEALTALGEITGEEVGDAVLDQIFSQFCLGK